MSKAKKYHEDIKNHIDAGYVAYEDDFITMNHKTLEDVEELIEKGIKENKRIKMTSINEQTNIIGQSRINQLNEIKEQIKSLKL